MPPRLALTTALAMLAFAGNSLLCRLALSDPARIDAASFTVIRLLSGALVLVLLVRLRGRRGVAASGGSWGSALALFGYAVCFSYAYRGLDTGTGALLLFGAVQASMIGWGLWVGRRLGALQWFGLALAGAGLIGLLLPGLSAPPWPHAALMLASGVAWGIYSIRGQGAADALQVTAGNFLKACAFAAGLGVVVLARHSVEPAGVVYAVLSGAVTSGLGYAIWYAALARLDATVAASVQLSVPPIAAVAGTVLLGEAPTLRLGIASVVILGGIALVIRGRRRAG